MDSVENPRKFGFPTETTVVATANKFEMKKNNAKNALKYNTVNELRKTLDLTFRGLLKHFF